MVPPTSTGTIHDSNDSLIACVAAEQKSTTENTSAMSRTSTRSCGYSLSKAWLGLAVPRSKPRYTCPESTLINRTGNCFATSTANAVLPTAVGPVIITIRRVVSTGITNCKTHLVEYALNLLQCSAPSMKPSVNFCDIYMLPGGAAMVTQTRPVGFLHLSKQTVHFR